MIEGQWWTLLILKDFSKLFLCRIDTSGKCFFDDIVKVAVRGPLRSKMISQALTENPTKSCDVSDVMGTESAPSSAIGSGIALRRYEREDTPCTYRNMT